MNMNGIPKKQHKLMRGLSEFLSSNINEIINDKNDIYKNLNHNHSSFIFGRFFNTDDFKYITKNFSDEQWEILISQSNIKVERKQKECQKEKEALDKLLLKISEDNFLKYHNITVLELVMYDKKYFLTKISFICGTYFLEGNINEIISDIRAILKENKIDIKVFCPNCSSKRLRFIDEFCLCNDCGAFSSVDKNKVVKKYKLEDKTFWWAKVLAEFGC